MKRSFEITSFCSPNQAGVSLIELMVAVTIGAILIFGATQVYVDSRKTYETSEIVARLQETARYAIAVIEPDVRMSNYWGLVKGSGVIANQASASEAPGGGPDNCGINHARDLLTNLEGTNNSYSLSCDAYGAGAVESADTLTVRRAATTIAAATAGTLQICSTRMMGRLFSDGGPCTAAPAGQVNDLIVNTYYVDRDSVQQEDAPALRRWSLAAGPSFSSQEIIPGVEDMQIQFGIDTTGTSAIASRYVNPGSLPTGAQIVAVRIWILVRAENPEVGFIDGRVYEYGDRIGEKNGNCNTADLNATDAATCAYAPADSFRRLLVSRTIQIRNAIGT
ncbi:PilW family protein [Povalibacter sp.]|uniref:PilW family protein n=1 Tax=Povalibacter sp. TaxID=1962978 RepID=UPI002F414830